MRLAGGATRSESGSDVDASGGLPDGSAFDGHGRSPHRAPSQPELFVGTLTEKLLTYGLGRGLEYYDAPAVREIVARCSRSGLSILVPRARHRHAAIRFR